MNSGTNPGDLAERVTSDTNPRDLAERVSSGTNLEDLAERVNSSTNPGDLAERVTLGTNRRDLVERVSSGTNLEDLAERVNSGTNPRDLAERMSSGTNPKDLAERVSSGTNLGDLAERVNLGTNPGDLAERVASGTNPRDLAKRGLAFRYFFEQVGMTSSDSSSSVRVISSPGSGGVSLGDPEASPSGASSGPPSPVDARALRDLEVMKVDHDLDTTVTEGSLAAIRERYSIPTEYRLHVSQPGQHPYISDTPDMCVSVDALEADLRFPLHPLIEECLRWWRISPTQLAPNSWRYLVEFLGECRGAEIILTRDLFMAYFRLYKSRGGYYLTAQVGFRVSGAPSNNKGWKSRYFFVSGPVWGFKLDWSAHPIGNAPPTYPRRNSSWSPVAPAEEPESLVESDEGDASPVHHHPRSMKELFKTKVHKDDAEYYALHMSDLGHQDPDKMKARWGGGGRLKNSPKVGNDSSATEEFEGGS
ncbi:hypothetical protein BHM03_00019442, partial [Ensete ventricosum]